MPRWDGPVNWLPKSPLLLPRATAAAAGTTFLKPEAFARLIQTTAMRLPSNDAARFAAAASSVILFTTTVMLCHGHTPLGIFTLDVILLQNGEQVVGEHVEL